MADGAHLDLLLAHLPVAVFFVDREGHIAGANPALLQLLGGETEQVLGRAPEELLDTADLERAVMAKGMGEARQPYLRTNLRRRDGSRIPVLLGLSPVERDGQHYGVVALALELARLEDSRPGPRSDPRHSLDRLKADFIAIASHELRTPLAIIKGYADAFLTGELGELDDFQRSRMSIIDARVDQMTGIIKDLLDLGRIGEQRLVGEFQKAPLGPLVETEVETMRSRAQAKGQELVSHVADGLPLATVDAERVRQALSNILDNAIKFTPEGGRIEVAAELAPGGESLRVAVSDSGPGIPPDELERVFSLFYQVDATTTRRAGGLGLGLFIAREISRAHGGDVRMESHPGQGSTCILLLPLPGESSS